MKEFNLSEKREKLFDQASNSKGNKQTILRILRKDIEQQDKEFIRRDNILIWKIIRGEIGVTGFWQLRDKLAGESLSK